MREKFTRGERNMTVWQRLNAALRAQLPRGMADELTGELLPYVLRERHDAETLPDLENRSQP